MISRWLASGVRAGLVGSVVGGVPSTLHAVLTGRDLRESTVAAGSLLLPREQRERRLVVTGAVVHVVISAGWGAALAAALPRRHTVSAGAIGGLAIAAVDLGLIGRHVARIAALPLLPQVADHVAYGTTVGLVLRAQQRRQSARFA
jgi:hypothetical protein